MKRILMLFCFALVAPSFAHAGVADKVVRKRVNGIDVIVYPTTIKDVVSISGALPGGDALALSGGDNPAVAKLTAMMLDRGTTTEDKFAIAKKLEGVGAALEFKAGQQVLHIDGRCLKADLPLVVGLLAEQLRTPAFSVGEFDKARQEFIGQQKNKIDNPQQRAIEALNGALFPAGQPNHEPTLDEYVASAGKLTVEDVKAFHHRVYGPDHMTLVFVGDVNPAQVQEAVARSFKSWKGGADYLRSAATNTLAEADSKERSIEVNIPGKTSSIVMIGQATSLRSTDQDEISLEVGTAILGSGFTGRLMHTVRDKEGLTYGIGAYVDDNAFANGSWMVNATFAPELLARGIASTQREVHLWWDKGVTDAELAARKTNLVGSYQVGLANTYGLADSLLSAVLDGHDVSWLDGYPKAVEAVTVDQVNAAIRKHLDPGKMVMVKAGTLSRATQK